MGLLSCFSCDDVFVQSVVGLLHMGVRMESFLKRHVRAMVVPMEGWNFFRRQRR